MCSPLKSATGRMCLVGFSNAKRRKLDFFMKGLDYLPHLRRRLCIRIYIGRRDLCTQSCSHVLDRLNHAKWKQQLEETSFKEDLKVGWQHEN